jgi:hypothetical protein
MSQFKNTSIVLTNSVSADSTVANNKTLIFTDLLGNISSIFNGENRTYISQAEVASLTGQLNGMSGGITGAYVTFVNGTSGNVVLIGGNGISISGLTISLTGSYVSEVLLNSLTGSLQSQIDSINSLNDNQSGQILSLSGNSISQASQITSLSANAVSSTLVFNASANAQVQTTNNLSPLIFQISGTNISQSSQISSLSGSQISLAQVSNASANALIQANNQSSAVVANSISGINAAINYLAGITGSFATTTVASNMSANALAQATSLININTSVDSNQATQIAELSGNSISQASQIASLSANAVSTSLVFSASANALAHANNQSSAVVANSISGINSAINYLAGITGSFVTTTVASNMSANAQVQTTNNLSPLIFQVSGNNISQTTQISQLSGNSISVASQIAALSSAANDVNPTMVSNASSNAQVQTTNNLSPLISQVSGANISQASQIVNISSANITQQTQLNGLIGLSGNWALDANVVHKTGNETIAGDKTFTGFINIGNTVAGGKVLMTSPGGVVQQADQAITINGSNVSISGTLNVLGILSSETSPAIRVPYQRIIHFNDSTTGITSGAYIWMNQNNTLGFGVNNNTRMTMTPGGLFWNSNPFWHSGNDGIGSGLDADLLDGQDGTFYSSLSTNASANAQVQTTNNLSPLIFQVSGNNISQASQISSISANYSTKTLTYATSANALAQASTSINTKVSKTGDTVTGILLFDNSTNTEKGVQFESGNLAPYSIVGQINQLKYKTEIDVPHNFQIGGTLVFSIATSGASISGSKVWHAGNDGIGSGLDADLLDGQNGSFYTTLSTDASANALAQATNLLGSSSVSTPSSSASTVYYPVFSSNTSGSASLVTVSGLTIIPSSGLLSAKYISSPRGGGISNNEGYGDNLRSITTGKSNIAVGTNALQFNDRGSGNIAVGTNSLSSNISGSYNIAIGDNALSKVSKRPDNIAIGTNALKNVTNSGNVAIGTNAASMIVNDSENVAIGIYSSENMSGSQNVSVGAYSSRFGVTAQRNTLIGYQSGYNVNGNNNTALGNGSLKDGYGSSSVAIGYSAMGRVPNYLAENVAVGNYSLYSNANISAGNTALGCYAGFSVTGGKSVFIGWESGYNEKESEKLYIANSRGTSASALIYGEFDTGRLTTNGNTIWHAGNQVYSTTPATSSSVGTPGTITYDDNYIYVCTATNTWRRAVLSPF